MWHIQSVIQVQQNYPSLCVWVCKHEHTQTTTQGFSACIRWRVQALLSYEPACSKVISSSGGDDLIQTKPPDEIYISKDTCLMNTDRVYRAVKSFLFLEDGTMDFWLLLSLSIKQQSQCGKVEKTQTLEAENLTTKPGSFPHGPVILGKSF